jgi:hypothetical protein
MSDTASKCAFDMNRDGNLYVVLDGKRIAKRGEPGTVHAKQWVSLDPHYKVFDKGKNGITIEYFDNVPVN